MENAKSILLVDDDPVVARIYSSRLSAGGFKVTVVSDGEAAMSTIDEKVPDALVLDLMLPGMDGSKVVKKLRGDKATKGLPIIVLTNSYLSKVADAALKAGANTCLSKVTCTPQALLSLINKTLGLPDLPPARRAADIPMSTSFQNDLAAQFLKEAPQTTQDLRKVLQDFTKASEADRSATLLTLYRKVHSLASGAGISGFAPFADMASAFEALLNELVSDPGKINASTLRTTAATVDLLNLLAEKPERTGSFLQNASVLAVDDDAVSRRAVVNALQRVKLKPEALETPEEALEQVRSRKFDLLVLDVQMPNMDGFELCKQIRAVPGHEKTPVIFVTSLSDFGSRAKSLLSGGNDLIAKPFVAMELGVKVLAWVYKQHVELPGKR